MIQWYNYTSKLLIYIIPAAKISRNAKFVAFLFVFLTKMKVDTESMCNELSIKQLRTKNILK